MVIPKISLITLCSSIFFVLYFFNVLLLDNHPPTVQAFKSTVPLNQSQTNDRASSVDQANHSPVVQNLNITISGTSPVAFSLKGTDQDLNDKLNYTILTEPVNGEIRINPPTGAVTYNPFTKPNVKWVGDAFTYKANDTKGLDSNVGVVTISKGSSESMTTSPSSDSTGGETTGGMITSPASTVIIAPGSSVPSNGRFFDPPTLKVAEGTTVTWKNDDSTLHTVTSGSPLQKSDSGRIFDSSYLASGKNFQWKFNNRGTFDYYCTLHPYMKGEVVVN